MSILHNRFIMFHKYHIPRDNLLNRSVDVTPDGKYVSSHKVKLTNKQCCHHY